MNKLKKENRILTFIKRIWKDSVWSKLISIGLISLIASIWTSYSNYSVRDIYIFFIKGLMYKIPVFVFLSFVGVFFIVKLLVKIFRKKTESIWGEQVGNYKFKELYEILSNQNCPIETVGMEDYGIKAPIEDLLTLFHKYSLILNRGVNMENDLGDGGYLYAVLAPKFVGYGLVNKLESRNLQIDVIDIKYETSEVGHKFFALLEKSIYLKRKKTNKLV